MSNARELSDIVSTDPSTDLNVDNNTLVVDVSTNKVGIGVTAPTEKLEVAGNLKIADEGTIGSATHANAISIASNGAVAIPNLNNPVINTGVGGTAVLDEDDLASDSDTQIATQQSIKAYVDSGTTTMTNKTLTSPVINTGVSGTAFIDDDTFGTATSTNFASAESIKAYVDASGTTYNTGTLSNFLYEGSTQITSGPSTYTCNYTQIGRVYHVQYHVVWNAANGQVSHTTTYQWNLNLPAGITNDMNDRHALYMYYGNSSGIVGDVNNWYLTRYYLRASDNRLVLYDHNNAPYTRSFRDNNRLNLTITYQAY